jgi:hypothetical protein
MSKGKLHVFDCVAAYPYSRRTEAGRGEEIILFFILLNFPYLCYRRSAVFLKKLRRTKKSKKHENDNNYKPRSCTRRTPPPEKKFWPKASTFVNKNDGTRIGLGTKC